MNSLVFRTLRLAGLVTKYVSENMISVEKLR